MSVDKKLDLYSLKKIVEMERAKDKVIVFANGCFDILHVGHIRYLKGAGALGDILIVAVNSDRSVRMLKGKGRPYTPENDRVEILSSIEYVDYILLFDEPDVSALLLSLKPDIQVKGTDYTKETVPEAGVVKSYGGRVAITGDIKTRSSSDIIKKIG